MATVLWVLMESLRWVAIAYQPVIPSLASGILDQLNVPLDARHFGCLSPECALVAGGALPKPEIIIPRYEADEDAAAAPAPPPPKKAKGKGKAKLPEVELTAEQQAAVDAQAAEVRRLKEEEGLGKEDPKVAAAVAELLRLKAGNPVVAA